MAKDDKELGEWVATSIMGVTTIKQFKRGFSIKKRGGLITEKLKYECDTTPKDMAEIMSVTILKKKLTITRKKTI